MTKKIMVSAIEVSGDMHAANLVQALKQLRPDLEFFGLGSEALRAAGVKIYQDVSSKSTIGILEPLKHLWGYLSVFHSLKKIMAEQKPDLLLCVDGQGFNLPLAAAAKSLKIPVVYYIAPQEWLWGTLEGGRKVAALCDLIIAIFPEEAAFYQKLGVKSVYNGHPLTDIVKADISRDEFINRYDLDSAKKTIAIFPGSRQQEINLLLPELLAVTKYFPDQYNFVIVAANTFYYTRIILAARNYDVKIILKDNYNAMNAADFIISATGTITLEAALSGTPLLAIYKMQPFSYWLVTKLFGSRLPRYKALPNMLVNREIIPEIIQYGVDAKNLAERLKILLNDEGKLKEIKNELQKLKAELTKPDVLKNNAQAILDLLKD